MSPLAAARAAVAERPAARRGGARGAGSGGGARRRRRKPVRRGLILAHRWLSLVLGGLLVVIATTGSVLVYEPEITRAMNADAYRVADPGAPARVGPGQAAAIVAAAHPESKPTSVTRDGDVWRVAGPGEGPAYTVDPAEGRIVGEIAGRPGWLALTRNIHHCFLTCPDLPGYASWLETEVPGTGGLTSSGKPVDVSGLILGSLAVLMIVLALSGVWLWFPHPRRLRAAFSVRWGKGRFARDLDLHKVIGVAALGPLLVWGVTATGFEFGAVKHVWYAVTPGSEAPPAKPPRPLPSGPDIGMDAAVAAASRAVPGEVMRVSAPKGNDPAGVYQVVLRRGGDAMAYSLHPGDIRVSVGRASGEAVQTRGNAEHDLTQRIWEQWKYPLHAGTFVGPWVRGLWFVGGLAPLALMVTGVSTWLVRRRTARARAAARRRAALAGVRS